MDGGTSALASSEILHNSSRIVLWPFLASCLVSPGTCVEISTSIRNHCPDQRKRKLMSELFWQCPLSSTTAGPRFDPQCLLDFPIELALRLGLKNTIRQNQHQLGGNSSSFTLSHIKHQITDAKNLLDENAFYSPKHYNKCATAAGASVPDEQAPANVGDIPGIHQTRVSICTLRQLSHSLSPDPSWSPHIDYLAIPNDRGRPSDAPPQTRPKPTPARPGSNWGGYYPNP